MYEKLDKKEREILFLMSVENKSKDELKRSYLNDFKLSEKSNDINLRIFERLIGVYNKYDENKKSEVKKELIKNLVKLDIKYEDLVKNLIVLKEKVKRSNRVNKEYDLKDLKIFLDKDKK